VHDLGLDLRDVVVSGDGAVYVTRFRSAEVLRLDAAMEISEARRPPVGGIPERFAVAPSVAWRALRGERGVMMLHQRALSSEVHVDAPGGYGSGMMCATGIAQSAFSDVFDGASLVGPALNDAALAVDMAVSPDGGLLAIASPGNVHRAPDSRIGTVILYDLPTVRSAGGTEGSLPNCAFEASTFVDVGGSGVLEATAVAFTPDGRLVAQSREPAGLAVLSPTGRWIPFTSAASAFDTGHRVFHMATGVGIACASCHPEGTDDGHTWNFGGVGLRRTQSLLGGVMATLPFHWAGDVPDLRGIMDATFTRRMSGGTINDGYVDALGTWMDTQPNIPRPAQDPASVDRGRAVFESTLCGDCHSGPLYTSNGNADVGGGVEMQIPSLLGVAYRAPFFHDGCAASLTGAIRGCGTVHDFGTDLTLTQIDDLGAFLETL
jgi:hypothetical protein